MEYQEKNKKILLNGIGCPYSGSRFILQQLLLTIPPDIYCLALLPLNNTKQRFIVKDNCKILYFDIKLWAKYLRPIYEIFYNCIFYILRFDIILNLSNYGLCLNKNHILYLQNELLVNQSVTSKLGEGYPNYFNRYLLNSIIKNGGKIIVQSEQMQGKLVDYITNKNLPLINIILIKPKNEIDLDSFSSDRQIFSKFNIFYPASDFPHKNVDLAIKGFLKFNKKFSETHFFITAKNIIQSAEISYLNQIVFEKVVFFYKKSQCLLFTSSHETLALPLLEALSLELPAILPNLSYAKEIYGDSAVYFERFDEFSIAMAIEELYTNYGYYKALVISRRSKEFEKRTTWKEHWKEFLK